MVNPEVIEKWGGGPVKMDDKAGSNFSLWGGDIHGKNIKVIKEKELIQDWFGGNWEKPSKLTFKLSKKNGKVELELTQEKIPESEYDDITDGWDRYYIGPLKKMLEESAE